MDWFKAKTGKTYAGPEDPGVLSVRTIYGYFKKFSYSTIVMGSLPYLLVHLFDSNLPIGASFRNKDEILCLAGCDKLTIAPSLLQELSNSTDHVERVLDPSRASELYEGEKVNVDESSFRYSVLLCDCPHSGRSDGNSTPMQWQLRSLLKEFATLLMTSSSSRILSRTV